MNKSFFTIALLVGLLAGVSDLSGQEDQHPRYQQPTLEDRIGQLEQAQQDLKAQLDQLRDDVADLQNRVKRLEGGPQTSAPPAAVAPPSGAGGRTSSAGVRTSEAGPARGQSFDL